MRNKITQYLANPLNYKHVVRDPNEIIYLVIHYTGNINDTALNNCKYYHDYVVQTSAHFFVDRTSVYQSVPELNIAWAVGGEKYASCRTTGGGKYYGLCKNSNSISIEICGGKKSYYPEQETLDNAVDLAVHIMQKYHIPLDRVIRHFDVTGKVCPAWAVNLDPSKNTTVQPEWKEFRNRLVEGEDTMTQDQFNKMMDTYLNGLKQKDPGWAGPVMQWAEKNRIATGGQPHMFPTRAEVLTMLRNMTTEARNG